MGPYLAQPNVQKHILKGQSNKTNIKHCFCEMQGWRRYMQDAAICQSDLGDGNALYAVFDGHGGPQVAKFVEKIFLIHLKNSLHYKNGAYIEAFIQTFKKVDEVIASPSGQEQLKILNKKSQKGSINQIISNGTGCTANVVLITSKKIIVANAGDSRSVLCRDGKAVSLSLDHKPQNQQEYNRIKKAGGQIINGRIDGGLNVSRTFGDFHYKKQKDKKYDEQLVICKPDVRQFNRNKQNDKFIVIGCDGIWERYVDNSQPLITTIQNEIKTKKDSVQICKGILDSLLAKETNEQIGCDNMTMILIQFL